MRRAAIITAIRTPIGRYGGVLASVRPDDLAALVIGELIKRSGIDPTSVEDVYFGAANQAGEDNRNVARMAALLAGLPETVPGCTVNRLCASGLEAINIAARMIETGHGDVMIAGGVESMSRAPFVVAKPQAAFDRNAEMYDTTIGWRFTNPKLAELYHPYAMGETAENVARKHNISRQDQDRFAFDSQQKWSAAKSSCKFEAEIVPVEIPASLARANAMTMLIIGVEGAAYHGRWLETRRDDYGRQTLGRLLPGLVHPARRYIEALSLRRQVIEELDAAVFARADVLHTPVWPFPIPTIAESDVAANPGFTEFIATTGHCSRPVNYAGLPGVSVPAGFTGNGLPAAFQLVGRPFDEARLLRAARAYERETGWTSQVPEL